MKVLFIAPFDLTMRGGTSIRVSNLAKAAARICEQVFLASHTSNEELESIRNLLHIRVKYIRSRFRTIMTLVNDVNYQLALKLIAKLLKSELSEMKSVVDEVDVIHVHQHLFGFCLAKILQRSMDARRAPMVVDLHGLLRLQGLMGTSLKEVLVNVAWLLHEFMVFRDRSVAAFTMPSKSLGEFLKSAYGVDPDKVFEVPDAVDQEVVATAKRCEEVEKEVERLLRGSELRNAVAYVGNLSRYHGFFDLVKAIKIAKRSLREIKLLLVVPSLKQLERFRYLLPEGTIALENVPRRLLPCILRRAALCVVPHRAGTQFDYVPSNKVYDYVLSGRPIVAYRTPAVVEVLSKYPMRVLVKPNDPQSLAEGIVKALELWEDSEPAPRFDCMPTLDDVGRSLRTLYHIISKAEVRSVNDHANKAMRSA
jgi:glycosyltransferase involved in cell wall biosynthesis